ncbi:MAG: hypothetical protein QM569_10590 [Acidovorax sp.]|uniref:hypothetical protein n=1 Tax=Acidovorax sp. TaxID=1872122 RepID=UPI0039E4EAEF
MARTSRNAPPVLYPLRRSRFLGALLVMIVLAGAGVLAGWVVCGAGPDRGWPAAAALCMWLVSAGGALHFWLRQPTGAIRWDGQFWALVGSDGRATALSDPPQVFLDLQSYLWMQVAPEGWRSRWLWLERSSQSERWMDLRRAVYSRAKPGAVDHADHAQASAPASSRGA